MLQPHVISPFPARPPRPRRRSKVTGAWLAAMALAASVSTAQAQDGGIAVGTAAPAAAVVTLDGKPANLSQYLGKGPVVLEFWATWCPLCKQLEPAMAAAQKEYKGRATFVSVGVADHQTAAAQRKVARERGLGGEFVFDRDGNAVKAYQAPHTSFLVVVDADGKVVYTGAGGEQDVAAAVEKAFASGMMGQGMGGKP